MLRMVGEIDVDAVGSLLDTYRSPLQVAAAALAAQGVRRVEMSQVTFLDSTGAGLLAGLTSAVRPAPLRVVGLAGAARHTLAVTGLLALMETHDPAIDDAGRSA